MQSKRIVITGAPGTGKTVVIEQLEAKGYYCFHEIIRTMTAEAKNEVKLAQLVSNPLAFVEDPYQFNQKLLKGRVKHFLASNQLTDTILFYDRGVPDVLAYMDYFNQAYDEQFIKASQEHRYDKLFIMPPWKEIYVSDDERLETFEEAEQLHGHLVKTYERFGYTPILVPKQPIEERVQFILKELNLA